MFLLTEGPLWLFAVIVVSITAASFMLGMVLGARRLGKDGAAEPVGAITGAVMALLAFMLAFTFGLAANRFDERRLLVLDSANAIGTAYLRTEFLDEPARSEMKELLREYVRCWRRGVEAKYTKPELDNANQLLNKMWAIAVDLGRKKPTPVSSLFISNLNDVIDNQEKRVSANLYARVPPTVWFYLLLVSTLSMAGMGYYCGLNGSKPKIESAIMVSAYAVVLLLAQDLDRPLSGILRTDQKPVDDLARQIGAL